MAIHVTKEGYGMWQYKNDSTGSWTRIPSSYRHREMFLLKPNAVIRYKLNHTDRYWKKMDAHKVNEIFVTHYLILYVNPFVLTCELVIISNAFDRISIHVFFIICIKRNKHENPLYTL